jgi:hypothetical protein
VRGRAKENGKSQFIGMFSIVDVFSLAQKCRKNNAGTKKNCSKKLFYVNRPKLRKKIRYEDDVFKKPDKT